jgi:hypothetical protein
MVLPCCGVGDECVCLIVSSSQPVLVMLTGGCADVTRMC